jgi:hypothetical protein
MEAFFAPGGCLFGDFGQLFHCDTANGAKDISG